MAEKESQHQNEDSPQEREPDLRFEHECPIDEIAQFVSDTRADKNDRRNKFSPEQAVERVKGFLERPNAIELILRRDQELVGCAFSHEVNEEEIKKEIPYANPFSKDGERVFKIREVCVKVQHRGHGFGQMIMERIMQEAGQKGATKLVLSTFFERDNAANRLYTKLGFKEVAPNQDEHNYYMYYDYEKNEK